MAGSRKKRLPSLKALLAFEATARNLNISRAAKELDLTASAVSHSIAVLEAQLHDKLFQRLRNGVALTDTGRQFLGISPGGAFDHGIGVCGADQRPQGSGNFRIAKLRDPLADPSATEVAGARP